AILFSSGSPSSKIAGRAFCLFLPCQCGVVSYWADAVSFRRVCNALCFARMGVRASRRAAFVLSGSEDYAVASTVEEVGWNI
uniref:hypothetical protein n=1 Tax=Alloprevotella sp. TaxID=1872471 RepID=UPI004024B0EF